MKKNKRYSYDNGPDDDDWDDDDDEDDEDDEWEFEGYNDEPE